MHLRKARPGEGQAIVGLHARTVREINSRDYTPEEIDVWLARKSPEKEEARIGAGEVYVCIGDDEALLGYGSRRGDRIAALYVAPDRQGQGVGSMLLAQLERDAIAEGIEVLELNSTLAAAGFYRQQGYETLGTTQCFEAGGQTLEAVAMRKRLL
jgi:putative acetyltransferase